tara:strand:+ start:386 stop:622 length:237 start_codon:yes stop_codon:yes gene_type:complete
MRSFIVSLTSFTLIALVVWTIAFVVSLGIGAMESIGLPSPLAWVGVGAAVVLCQPASALLEFSSTVYERVDALFWRMF